MKSIVKSFSWVFFAQMIVLLISIGRAIILPKYLSVEDFGYWEVYWFYSCYVALFCFGYNDGIYLQYGECDYSQLPIKSIRSANRLLAIILSILSIIGMLTLLATENNSDLKISYSFVLLNIPVVCITGVLIYIFQITKKFKEYSVFSIIDKVLVFSTIIALILFNKVNYPIIIITDFIGRLLVVGIMIIKRRDLFFGEIDSIKESMKFMLVNMGTGIKLMIANLMGMLLIGSGKMIVQILGNISDFAVYSFGLSITGLILTTVTSISLVLYPTIKRKDGEVYKSLFKDISSFTRLIGFVSLLVYFPCYIFISYYYPQYNSILPYMNWFFIIVFANIKISVLNNTFYKVLRKEDAMLKANIWCIIFFVIICVVGYIFFSKIWVVALCTAIALLMRYSVSELYLAKVLYHKCYKSIISELFFLVAFIATTYLFQIQLSFIIVSGYTLIWLIVTAKPNIKLLTRLLK